MVGFVLALASRARLGWLVSFGLSVGACAALSSVIRAHRRGALIAISLTALALVESWPGALPTASWPAPRFLRNLARDGERWTVLDATAPGRRLWHQLLHRHPQLGGTGSPGEAPSATGSALVDGLVERAVPPGAAGETTPIRPASSPSRSVTGVPEAIRALQRRNVRFVIADEETLGVARSLRLPAVFSGDGIVVFEVPPATS
jgi:hypothetical protein